MRKKLLLIPTVILLVAALTALLGFFIIPEPTSAWKYKDATASVQYQKARNLKGERAKISIPKDRDLKILLLTDPQVYDGDKYLSVGGSNEKTYAFIEDLIATLKPDLTVINGDLAHIFEGSQWDYLEKYAEIFERQNALWTMTFGNHDSENQYVKSYGHTIFGKYYGQMSKDRVVKALSKYPHCLLYLEEKEDGFNYLIDLTFQEKTVRRLVCFDTEYAVEDGEKTYSTLLTPSQLSFYREAVTPKTGETPVRSTVFSHVALPEYFHAANLLDRGEEVEGITYNYGVRLQGDYSKKMSKNGLFHQMQSFNSTDSAFFGHHHDNDLNLTYQGVLMATVPHSGFSHNYRTIHREIGGRKTVSFKRIQKYGDQRGGILLSVDKNGEMTQNRVVGSQTLENYAKDFSLSYSRFAQSLIENPDFDVIG